MPALAQPGTSDAILVPGGDLGFLPKGFEDAKILAGRREVAAVNGKGWSLVSVSSLGMTVACSSSSNCATLTPE